MTTARSSPATPPRAARRKQPVTRPDRTISPHHHTACARALVALLTLLMAVFLPGAPARARAAAPSADVEFNADFLQGGGGQRADLSRFSKENAVPPGEYLVDLVLNGEWKERLTVRFSVVPGARDATPCLTLPVLLRLGLRPRALPSLRHEAWAKGRCVDAERLPPGTRVTFDMATLTLALSVPQAALIHRPHGYVSPQSWDKGVPSATLAYDASLFRSSFAGLVKTSVYAGLTAGANLGDWHFRNRAVLTGNNGHWSYQNIAAYVQRDLPVLQSSLTLGDTYTDGAVYDSFGFRGVSLATDDRMRPDSLSGYAPVVRGIAHTNARVRITQHGTLLLETTVAPGAFQIDDLYPTGYGGDLLVTVLEADGTQESFTVSYASLVQSLRPHVWRYGLAAGKMQVIGSTTRNRFAQATVQRGITNLLTAYGGAQGAPGYASGLLGVAINTHLGGLAVDVTLARNGLPGNGAGPPRTDQGQSVRVSYSKNVPGIGTNLALSAFRYSSGGFWSLQDAMANRSIDIAARNGPGTVAAAIVRQHSRFQINVSQALPRKWGNIYLNGSTTRYYDTAGTVTQFQAGYSNVASAGKMNVTYGVSVSRQRNDATERSDTRVLFNLAMTLGRKSSAPRLAANLVEDRADGRSQTSGQLSIAGTAGVNGEYTYGATANVGAGADAVAANAAWHAPFATVSGSAGVGNGFSQTSFGVSGGIVVHPGGVTLASQLGDTIAIADAPGAKGASVSTGNGTRIDGAGYAVVPYLLPYRENQVAIDPHGTALDVEMQITSQQVAPHANAVVMLHYPTSIGTGVLFAAKRPDGSPVPFGATVSLSKQPDVGIVGQNGQVFLRTNAAKGQVQVAWGTDADAHCAFDYVLPKHVATAPLIRIATTCLPD